MQREADRLGNLDRTTRVSVDRERFGARSFPAAVVIAGSGLSSRGRAG
jgi:hypothetical protein